MSEPMKCWHIRNYDRLYLPTDTKGKELVTPVYVKCPVKYRGEGLSVLATHQIGLDAYSVWMLSLQKATAAPIGKRGWLWNHKDKPASIEEIACAIQLPHKIEVVRESYELLQTLEWMEFINIPEHLLRTNSVPTPINYGVTTDKIRTDSVPTTKSLQEQEQEQELQDKQEQQLQNKQEQEQEDVLSSSSLFVRMIENIYHHNLTVSEISTFSKIFDKHFEIVGQENISERVEILCELAIKSRTKINPKAWFNSEQKRLWPEPADAPEELLP